MVGSLRIGVKPGNTSRAEVSAGLVWGWDGEMLELRRLPGLASAGAQGSWLGEAERGRAWAWGEARPGGLGWSTPLWAQLCPRRGGELREVASSSASLLPSGRLLQPDPRDQSSPCRAAGLLKHRYPISTEPC